MRARRIAPWIALSLTVGGAGFAVVLNALAGSHGDDALTVVAPWLAAIFASSGVGLVLATRRRENPIGWLLLANGLVLAAMALADSYADYAVLENPDALPGGEWAVLSSERGWPALFVGVTAIAFVFPDGRLPSPALAADRHRGRGVVRVLDRRVAARGGALQRAVRARLEPAPELLRVGHRHPVHDQRPRGVAGARRGGPGRANEDAAVVPASSACS